MDIEQFFGFLLVIILFAVILLGCIGYVKNIAKLTKCDFEPPYKAEIIHGAGIIPIVGAITGYMNVGK